MLASHGYSLQPSEYDGLTMYQRTGFIEAAQEINRLKNKKGG